MRTLLAAGAHPNDADELGNRALHMVCCTRSVGLDISLGRDKYGTMTTSACPSLSLGSFTSLSSYHKKGAQPSGDLAVNLWHATPQSK